MRQDKTQTDLVVFSDLDGTLLDHQTYSFAPARPALAELAARGVPVILASSKTAAEIRPIQVEMGLQTLPAIVENGAAIVDSTGATEDTSDYEGLRAALDRTPADLRAKFHGFGDCEPADVARMTGLSAAQAAQAQARQFSEPGIWRGSEAEEAAFVAALSRQGVQARRGGRFLTLSFGGTKAGQMRQLLDRFQPRLSVALGDAPNDIEMLEAADIGIILDNPLGTGLPPLDGEAQGRIRRSTRPGPEGWNMEILKVLQDLDQDRSLR